MTSEQDLTPNIPEVVEEVRQVFERYEQALIDKDVDVLDATFWESPHTIRCMKMATVLTKFTNTASPGHPAPASRSGEFDLKS